MAEWVWLLRKHDHMIGDAPTPLGAYFLGAALRAAEPNHGFLIDEIDTLSRPRKNSRRLWPQTELLKGLARAGGNRSGPRGRSGRKGDRADDGYLPLRPLCRRLV